MRRFLLLSLISFLAAAAERQDLSGKMATFPMETNTAHMALTPEMNKDFVAATVCLRAFSDLSRFQSLFSLSLPTADNGFVLYKPRLGSYEIVMSEKVMIFNGLEDKLNDWNSVCATWDSTTGIVQLWVNGNPSSRKGFQGGSLKGIPKIILGQEQDSYGGTFDSAQSFVGMLTDVHMWNTVLSFEQLAYYSYGLNFQPGNILNWNSLEFSKIGYVIIESKERSQKAGNNVI